MRDTTTLGDLAEIEIAAALMRSGRRVLRPLSNGLRYDLVVDNNDGTFTRVQCKSGVLKNGGVLFRVYSVSGHRTQALSYHGQVDAFGVYCSQTRATYLVPMADIEGCNTMVCLRVSPAKNSQTRGIHLAEDYRIDRARPA
ncbi:MAG: group I intron-associated PD-(D/E)XK endonuclease [Chloroflexota bacterium]|nr:group I intron-associated PD-(D/E)XK endonuclease [Chloroflexota bacterium]